MIFATIVVEDAVDQIDIPQPPGTGRPFMGQALIGQRRDRIGQWRENRRAYALDLPRPIFMYVGRVTVEKNVTAFLDLDLPGSKVVVGSGPQRDSLIKRYPDAHFHIAHGDCRLKVD